MQKTNIKEKLLSQIKKNKLYNKKMTLTVQHLFDLNKSKISRGKIRTTISQMGKEGQLLVKDGKIVSHDKYIVGTFETRRFGGVVVAEILGEKKEFYVGSSNFQNIPHKTLVGFVADTSGKKPIAHIGSIISFNENSLFGNVKLNKQQKPIFIPDFNPYNAKFSLENNQLVEKALGKKCRVKITRHLTQQNKFKVEVASEEDIFGSTLSPLAHTEAVLKEEGLSRKFSEDVLKNATNLPRFVSENDVVGRKDYRNLFFVTIDPEEAKDLDDAVYLEKGFNQKGEPFYKYIIAVADISHYVTEGSKLDKEAFLRSFSVYPAGGVVPMLPTSLSNNICSLKENEDRLALVTEITFDNLGNITDYSIFNGVISNKLKMSYSLVQQIYNNEVVLDNSQKHIKTMIDNMYELTDKIDALGKKKGTISLVGYQPTILLNQEKDDVVDYVNKNNLSSNRIIEKAMVSNNVVVAKFLKQLNIPFLSRIHKTPFDERFKEFVNYLSFAGIDTAKTNPTNRNYIEIANLIKNHYMEKVLTSRLVRSMQKAKYTSDSETYHFALAEDDYTHFTAGIRRYVDIVTHRTLKKVLEYYNEAVDKGLLNKNLPMSENAGKFSKLYDEKLKKLANSESLEEIANYVNQKENDYMKVEERTNAISAAIFVRNHIGKTFPAYISSVEKDHVVATLKDENDPEHSDIIDVIIPLKNLLKSKRIYVDFKNWSVNETKSSKMIYYEGKRIDLTVSHVNLAEGKIFGEDDFLKRFEVVKNTSNQTQKTEKALSQSL